jgi:hypothetical protein
VDFDISTLVLKRKEPITFKICKSNQNGLIVQIILYKINMKLYTTFIQILHKIELIDCILVAAWILLNIAITSITFNWLRQGYYFLPIINITITVVLSFLCGTRTLNYFYYYTFNRYIPSYYYKTIIKGFFLPVKIIINKDHYSDLYFTRKAREISDFCVVGLEIVSKWILLFIYSFLFDIGDIDHYLVKCSLVAITIIWFIIIYIYLQVISKPLALFITFWVLGNISGIYLLYLVLDYILLFNLMLKVIIIILLNTIIKFPKTKTLWNRIRSILLVFNLNLYFVSDVKEDNLFMLGSKYDKIWTFVNDKERGNLQMKLQVARKVIAEKLIKHCDISEDDIPSREAGFQVLLKSTDNIGLAYIMHNLRKKSVPLQIIYNIFFGLWILSSIFTIFYLIVMFTPTTLMTHYTVLIYEISALGMCFSGVACIPLIKFIYYSNFMSKVPNTLIIGIDDIDRMKNLLSEDVRC